MRSNPAWLTAALLLLWIPWPATIQAQAVAPTLAQTVPAEPGIVRPRGGASQATPRVLRGSAIKPKPAPKRRSHVETVAGETFWTFDRARGRLVGCEREYGMMVGQTLIRCTQGHLPHRLHRQ
jgi:hypothetical protein